MVTSSDVGLRFWRSGEITVPVAALIRWARAQRLLLLLPWRAQQRGWSLPAPLLAAVRQEGYVAAAWQARAVQVLRTLGALAQAMDAPAVIVKGPLAAEAYPNPLLRPYGDLDLLIRPQDADRWTAALGDRGYRALVGGSRSTHLAPLLPPGRGPRVEFHTALDHTGERFTWERWEARTASWSAVPGLLQPGSVDHFLYLVYHAVERHSLQFGLGGLADLAFWTAGWSAAQWEEAAREAAELGLARAVGLALALLAWFWDTPPAGSAWFPMPPQALLTTAQRQLLAGGGSVPLPNLWRDLGERTLRSWLAYLWLILWGDPVRLRALPWRERVRYHLRRPGYLMRQHAPAFWRLLRAGSAERGAWRLQRDLMAWLHHGQVDGEGGEA